jgi:hypothetical protein
MRKLLLLSMACFCLLLTGCAQVSVKYQSTLSNVELLKAGKAASLNVGNFALAPGLAPEIDKNVSARGSTLAGGEKGLFSQYLKDALTEELKAAGKFDPASGIVISGLLTRSSTDAPVSGNGKAELGAKFSVQREGKVVYDKELVENAEWPSSFIGATAIPAALNGYASLYQKILGSLFGDDAFKKAVEAKPPGQ